MKPVYPHSKIKAICIGDFASQNIEALSTTTIRDTDILLCHYKSQILESLKVSKRIKLNEDLDNFSINSLNNEDTLKNLFPTNHGLVFLITDLKIEWNRKAMSLLIQLAKERNQLTMAVLPFSSKTDEYYSGWENNPGKFIDAIFSFKEQEIAQMGKKHGIKNEFSVFVKGIIETFTTIIDTSNPMPIETSEVEITLKNSSKVLIGEGISENEDNRAQALKNAFKEEMKDFSSALLFIQHGRKEITMNELGEMTDYLQDRLAEPASIIWGIGQQQNSDNKIKATIIASKKN